MITGAFPPSSRWTFFKLLFAELDKISRPITVEPVKLIFLISGWLEIAAPASCPYPGTMFSNPLGNPSTSENI